jgi:hypothetical protein
MRRLVIRFKDGSTTGLDLVPGREREDLLRHLRHFPGKEVGSVEEQVYAPEHPRRFRYVRREDLGGTWSTTSPRTLGSTGPGCTAGRRPTGRSGPGRAGGP